MATIYTSKLGNKYRIVEITLRNGDKRYEVEKKLQIGQVIKDMFDKNPSALIISFPLLIIVLFLAWLVIRWGWEEYTNQSETKELALQSISKRMEDDEEEYERKKRISGKKEIRRKVI